MSKKMKTLVKLTQATVVCLIAFGCGPEGDVPKAYRGVFKDNATGVQLDLPSNGGQIQIGGKTFQGRSEKLTYEKLSQAIPAFYGVRDTKDDKELKVNWIIPDPSTKEEAGGIVTYKVELFYARFNLAIKNPVDSIEITHSADGRVMIDTLNPHFKQNPDDPNNWQIGWGKEETFHLVRTAKSSGVKIPETPKPSKPKP